MSRAYRVEVRESENVTVRASDEISTRITLLDILSPEETGELLRRELARRGFSGEEGAVRKTKGEITITVDPCSGDVSLKIDTSREKTESSVQRGIAVDDVKGSQQLVEGHLKEKAIAEIEHKIELEKQRLQREASERLEQAVRDFQPELKEIVNEVTKAALKTKAARLGQIKEVVEDQATGSMTITVEV